MNPDTNKRIEEILSSLDGAQRAQAPAFFYTRLKARMEGALNPRPRPFILRPVYIIASLLVILMLNMLALLNSGSPEESITEQEVEQSIAAEYSIDTNLTYELNQ